MRSLSSGQDAILAGRDPGFVALLFEMQLSGGIVRLSTLPFAWTDGDAITWPAGAGVIYGGQTFQRKGVEGGAIQVVFAGADTNLMTLARDNAILGAPFTRYIATADNDGNQVGAKLIDFVGECEIPEIDPDPEDPQITLTIENKLVKLRRSHAYRLTPESHARHFSGDTFFDFVADLQDKDIFSE